MYGGAIQIRPPPINWHGELYWAHHSLARALLHQGRFNDARAHVEQATSHAVNHAYNLGCVIELQAEILYEERMLEEARSEVLRAVEVFEKLGAAKDLERCRENLQWINRDVNNPVALYFDGKPLEIVLLPAVINSPFISRYGRHRMAPSRIFIQTHHVF